MKPLIIVGLCLLILPYIASARTWTDNTGRTIEADMISADTESATVLFNGKEVNIPRSKLSEADQKFCDEWLENQDKADVKDNSADTKPAANGQLEFDGKPLAEGGKVNVYIMAQGGISGHRTFPRQHQPGFFGRSTKSIQNQKVRLRQRQRLLGIGQVG